MFGSITDEHFRGWTRLPAFGRDGERWIAAFSLSSGEPVYGLGEKFSPLNRRGQLLHSQVEDALGVNTGLSYKNAPFCWSPEGWGVFVNTPGRVSHGVGYPEWSHRSYVAVVEDEALDLFFLAADSPARLLSHYTELTGRAPEVPTWGLGLWVSKAYYRTPREAIDAAAALREHRIPCDVLTLDGRAVWDVQTRFDFRWDESRYPDPKAALASMRAFGLRICVWLYPYVSIHSPRYGELAARGFFLKSRTSDEPYVFDWDADPATSPFGSVLTPLPPSAIIDFTNPEAYAFWRDEHEALFDAGVDVIKADFGEHVPDECVAWNGDSGRRLHNVYALLYNRCEYEAAARYGRGAAMVWGRANWTGASAIPSNGVVIRNRIGRACARRFAAGWRGDSPEFRSTRPTSEAFMARSNRTQSSTCAGSSGAFSRRTCGSMASGHANPGPSAPKRRRSRSDGFVFGTGCSHT